MCDLPVSMRLRSRLSTTAALLSMCFCSVSNTASSLSTYWLVSCRHWPQTPSRIHANTHTITHEHTQDNGRQSQREEREGGKGKREPGEMRKQEEEGQKIREQPKELEKSSCEWRMFNILEILAAISHVSVVIWSDSEGQRNRETFKQGTHNWPVVLLLVWQAGCQLCSAALHTCDKTTCERTESKKQRGEVKLISKNAQTSGSHLCYWRSLRSSQSLHLQPGQEKEKTFICSKYHKAGTYQHIKNIF